MIAGGGGAGQRGDAERSGRGIGDWRMAGGQREEREDGTARERGRLAARSGTEWVGLDAERAGLGAVCAPIGGVLGTGSLSLTPVG